MGKETLESKVDTEDKPSLEKIAEDQEGEEKAEIEHKQSNEDTTEQQPNDTQVAAEEQTTE